MKSFNCLLEECYLEESIPPIKKRINPAIKNKRKATYRVNKNKVKLAGKKYRKTANYKKWKVTSKRLSKQGKTATGKRKSVLL